MQTRQVRNIILICITAILPLFSGCLSSTTGGGNAETQASLPTPVEEEDSGVTISSPSGAYVIVTGRDAVPDSATVIASVSGGSSTILNILSSIIPTAAAQSCQSTLPTCPEISSDGECQFTADAEGSFTFQFPAELGDEITLSYIDSSSCQEIAFVEEIAVDNDTPFVDYLVEDVTFDLAERYAILIGTDHSLLNSSLTETSNISVFDWDTRVAQTAELSQTFFPTSVDSFSGTDAAKYLVLSSDSESVVGQFNLSTDLMDGTIDYYTILDSTSSTPILNLRYLSAAIFDQASNASCDSIPSGADPFMRLFFTTGEHVLYHEFGTDLSDARTGSVVTYDGSAAIIPHSLSFSIYDPSVGPLTVVNTNFFYMDSSSGILHTVLLLEDSSNVEYYYYFTFDPTIESNFNGDLCSGYLSKSIDAGFLIASSDTSDLSDFDFHLGEGLSSTGIQTSFLAAFNKADQKFVLIDTTDFNNYVEISFDSSRSEFTTIITSVEDGLLNESSPLITPVDTLTDTILEMHPLVDTNGYANLFFVGQNFGGAGFLDIFGEAGTILPSIMPSVINPIDMIFDTDMSQVIIFDTGLSSTYADGLDTFDDVFTFIKFYGLDGE